MDTCETMCVLDKKAGTSIRTHALNCYLSRFPYIHMLACIYLFFFEYIPTLEDLQCMVTHYHFDEPTYYVWSLNHCAIIPTHMMFLILTFFSSMLVTAYILHYDYYILYSILCITFRIIPCPIVILIFLFFMITVILMCVNDVFVFEGTHGTEWL